MDDVAQRWTEPERARHYARGRFRGRAASRDPRLVEALLAGRSVTGPVLDVPCGTGRLRPGLERHGAWVGVDRSAAMLRHAGRRALRADAAALPFRDGSFELVVCCRLLHHLGEGAALDTVLGELVRVSRRWVVASYWDARSWGALRRRRGWSRSRDARCAIERARLEQGVELAGARVVSFRHSLRFVSQQGFFLAEKC